AEQMRTKPTEETYHRRRVVAATSLALLISGGILGHGALTSDTKPVTPAVSADEVETHGTVVVVPESGDGYRSLVLGEAGASGVGLTEEELDELVVQAEGLNPGKKNRVAQPHIGVGMLVPNIVGPDGVDLTPPDFKSPQSLPYVSTTSGPIAS
ncbi:MAG: hypothetical protein ACI9T8_000186, partial [Candidatus Saccharimonadales bacterium]